MQRSKLHDDFKLLWLAIGIAEMPHIALVSTVDIWYNCLLLVQVILKKESTSLSSINCCRVKMSMHWQTFILKKYFLSSIASKANKNLYMMEHSLRGSKFKKKRSHIQYKQGSQLAGRLLSPLCQPPIPLL